MLPYSIILYFLIALVVTTIIHDKYYLDCSLWIYNSIFDLFGLVFVFIFFPIFFNLLNIKKLPKSSTNISSKKLHKIIIDSVLFFALAFFLLARSISFIYGRPMCGYECCNKVIVHDTFDEKATVHDTFNENAN